jgi:CHAT domain-containing protein
LIFLCRVFFLTFQVVLDTFLRGVRSNSNTQAGVELVPLEAEIVAAYDALVERAIANGKRLSELESKPSLTAAEEAEMVALQGERRELLQAFTQFRTSDLVQRALAQLSPAERDRNLQLGQLAALQDNLSQIPQGAVLLYPLILEDRLELVVTSPYAPPIRRTVNVTPAQLAAAVQAFRYALELPTRDAITPAQQLYGWLIAPIEADLEAAGVDTLIYAPDRILRYIPLAALHDGDQWLTERYRINHITAASLTDLNTPPTTEPRILAGALTEGPVTIEAGGQNYNFSLLRHAEAEVNGIAALDPRVNPLLGANFTPDQVEREANRHTIVHLATHAKFLVGQPEDSFILFSNRNRWTLADFNAGLLNLTQVDLVVLSACETGVDNTFGNGEEILGFGYLMQAAGARATIASLWAVDDGGTQILMGEFYDALLRGRLGKAEALRQAQLSLIHLGQSDSRGFELAGDLGLDPNNLAHPHYWAPFILIGNGL